jgi:hypothetical protein
MKENSLLIRTEFRNWWNCYSTKQWMWCERAYVTSSYKLIITEIDTVLYLFLVGSNSCFTVYFWKSFENYFVVGTRNPTSVWRYCGFFTVSFVIAIYLFVSLLGTSYGGLSDHVFKPWFIQCVPFAGSPGKCWFTKITKVQSIHLHVIPVMKCGCVFCEFAKRKLATPKDKIR